MALLTWTMVLSRLAPSTVVGVLTRSFQGPPWWIDAIRWG